MKFQCPTCKHEIECSSWVRDTRERANKKGIACQQWEKNE